MTSWPIDWPEASLAARSAAGTELVALAEDLAAKTLRMLTLYRVGGLPSKVMPTGRTCTSPFYRRDMFFPTAWTSARDLKACNCSLVCGCGPMNWVYLSAPVGDILEVRVDGEIVDPADYHVEDGEKLVRHSGGWPACAGPDFTVTYLRAHKVDALGAYAGGLMAEEWLKFLTNDKKCKLSAKATSVNRQGMSATIEPGMFPDGTTGIEAVDLYIREWNPNGIKQAPAVYSIDAPRQREVSWGAL